MIKPIMTDIVKELLNPDAWQQFLEDKLAGGNLSKREETRLRECVENEQYRAVATRLNNGAVFSVPTACKVNKGSSGKKRTVFLFPEEETIIQKFIARHLLVYDDIFCDNLYSFRKNTGVKKAVGKLFYAKGIQNMHAYKTDISDYFNSVDVDLLLPRLKEVLCDQRALYRLLEAMLTQPYCYENGQLREMKKGILAGSPISGFLANLYLTELDRYFEQNDVLYARYSDDIICFCADEAALEKHRAVLERVIAEKHLCINAQKVVKTAPHEAWDFLGFCYADGVIDISAVSKKKIKQKMRRKARALVRWKHRKQASDERAVKAFVRHFNKKFYAADNDERSFARWYFPVITTAAGLKEIDAYMQHCMRVIATEQQNKKQYAFSYEQMKACGYEPLVTRYYKQRNLKAEKR